MTPESEALLARLDAFQFEPSFVAKLARENGWSPRFAQRACQEYKRFVFLTRAAGHACAPSDAIDQVWHLHVLHTEAYRDFCAQLLRAPLHHQPAGGSAHAADEFRGWYRDTLASYRRCFGEAAPAALWPAPERYLDGDFRRIDQAAFWLIPRPRWPSALLRLVRAGSAWLGRSRQRALALAAASLAVAGCSLIQRVPPFDLAGPSFLLLFVAIWTLSLLVVVVARGLKSSAALEAGAVQPYELAYLAGGPWQVAQAGIAALVHNDQLRVGANGEALLPDGPQAAHARKAPRAVHPLELALLERCAQDGSSGTAMAELRPVVTAQCAALAEALEAKGLLRRAGPRRLLLGLALLAPLLGVVKVGVGLALGRPVLYLVLLCAVAIYVAYRWLGAARQVTPAGNDLVRSLRQDAASAPTEIVDGHSMAWAVALFGAGALTDTAFADVRRMLAAPAASRGSSWSSSDSSSSDSSWGSSDSSSSDSGSSCSSSSDSSGCSSSSSSGCGGCSSSSSSSD
jgi:uncharacterized protein (TIGR04222 family)